MTDKELKFKCTKDCKKKNTSECYELNCIGGQANVLEQLARKTQIVEQQQKTLDELIGCMSIWEGFTEEESKLAKDSSIADLIMLLRKKTQECEELKFSMELLSYKYKKCYSSLDKIEKICKKSSKEWEAYKDETCIFHCKTRKTDKAKLADKILDIINKAKEKE